MSSSDEEDVQTLGVRVRRLLAPSVPQVVTEVVAPAVEAALLPADDDDDDVIVIRVPTQRTVVTAEDIQTAINYDHEFMRYNLSQL
jgi:hypothetical protein